MRVTNLNAVDVLIYSRHKNLVHLEKTALHSFGVKRIESVGELQNLKEAVRHNYRDIIIINHAPGLPIAPLVEAVRSETHASNPYGAVLLMTATPSQRVVREAVQAGVDGVMALPFTGNDLWRQIVNLVNQNRAFVRTENYFGPCRRRLQNIKYNGAERRDDAA
ncbi:response regulator [Hirschia baltica]|uniref:Response regulator receiver protein n=1 Tax=Hirschia baltica (strain ATCC 49814 / DSM 5838 / IFAM 1418) TaxID=582402 RepID=C6XRH1_HIRBI|nr:hypothetical protein [Hirschia baltica]ACT58803.1 response regulator receiver protein [Hirschia baltica ATCC 49814]